MAIKNIKTGLGFCFDETENRKTKKHLQESYNRLHLA
jgi:hypothetical protein